MRINHNIAALNTYRQLSTNNASGAKSLERLSSGLRINRAGDDAAGLAISEKMRGQIRGLDQASRNAQDGISLIQTAEGALSETHSMLQRMRELAVQANNDTNTPEDRQNIQDEMSALIAEVTAISTKTQFNGKTLLNGSLGVAVDDIASPGTLTSADLASSGISVDLGNAQAGETFTFTLTASASGTADTLTLTGTNSGIAQTITLGDDGAAGAEVAAGRVLNFDALGVKVTFNADTELTTDVVGGTNANLDAETFTTAGTQTEFQIGANGSQTLQISINAMDAVSLGVSAITVSGPTYDTFDTDIVAIDTAIKNVSAQRSSLGAYQNRLEHTINNLGTTSENLTASESRVRDVDMAKEMMEYTKNNILSQAATAMLAQANQAPQGVLQLLR